jgi:hypothetical protein
LTARDNVIERQVTSLTATILACIPVTHEHLEPGETTFVERAPHALCEAYHRGDWKDLRHAMYFTAAVFHQFSLAAVDEHDSAAGATHIVGLEALIQDQYGSVCHTGALAVF